jgi:hypothetical protein
MQTGSGVSIETPDSLQYSVGFASYSRIDEEIRMLIEGGCLCRAVRFGSTTEPMVTRICWCRVCQYLGAGNATVNVFFRSESFTIQGKLTDHRSIADSGNVMHRRFCPGCGTAVLTQSEARPHLLAVRAGTLDDTAIAKPAATIWTSRAPPWARFDQSLPKFDRHAPPLAQP